MLGIEIKVIENDFPGLLIAKQPTYLESGVGLIDFTLDGVTAQDVATIDKDGEKEPLIAKAKISV